MKKIATILGCLLSLIISNANAASSEIFLNNASGLGNAYSGEAAIADDASTEYFNPAGLSRIHHPQFIIGDVLTRFNGTYRGSDNFAIPPFVFIPQSGYVNGQATLPSYPFFYYSQPLMNKFTFGLGIMTPYGIGAAIPDTSIVRYAGTRIIMYVIDFSPALSYQINEQFSAGLAFDLQRMSFLSVVMFPSSTGGPDSRIRNDATSFGYGMHGGVIYYVKPGTRVGLVYHSQSVFHPNGSSELVITPGRVVGNEIISNNFKFNTTMPPTTSVSVYHEVNPKWALLGTINYSQWSFMTSTRYLNIASQSPTGAPAQINATTVQNYRNTWRFALGTNYLVKPQLMIRFGLAFETDPTIPARRSITDPGTASTAIAAGLHYQAVKTFGLDVGYEHFFLHDSSIHTVSGLNTENGTETLQRDALGLQATWDIV